MKEDPHKQPDPNSGFERSYAGLRTELVNILRSERAIWSSLKGGWYVLYFLHLPLILVLFIPHALLSAIIWPLGKLRGPITVGITIALLSPFFDLALANYLCAEREVSLRFSVVKQGSEQPIDAEILVEGHEVQKISNGTVEFKTRLMRSRLNSQSIARHYCPGCFEPREFRIQVVNPAYNLDTVLITKFNIGERLFPNSPNPVYPLGDGEVYYELPQFKF